MTDYENQHPGEECCGSCADDQEYDDGRYSMWPNCCCRSELSLAEAEAAYEEWKAML